MQSLKLPIYTLDAFHDGVGSPKGNSRPSNKAKRKKNTAVTMMTRARPTLMSPFVGRARGAE
jgi:hypothetical protein